jgi:hypothetical protein
MSVFMDTTNHRTLGRSDFPIPRHSASPTLSSLPEDSPHTKMLRLLHVLSQLNTIEAECVVFVGDKCRLSTGRAGSPWPEGRLGPALKNRGPGQRLEGPALRLRAKGRHQLKGQARSDPGQART